jgi:hypothetical protein
MVDNGNWYGNNNTVSDSTTGITMSSSAGNCTLKATGGTYTFSYNTSTRKLAITFAAAETESTEATEITSASTEAIVTNYYLAGGFNNWSVSATPMAVSGTKATTTVTLAAGTYEFKVVDNNNWYGYNSTINNTTST